MDKLGPVLICVLLGYTISNVCSIPVDVAPGVIVPGGEVAAVQNVQQIGEQKKDETEPSKEDSTKLSFQLPPYLMGSRPSPVAYGNATTQGDVGAIYAQNENSLYVLSGPNSNAVANLTSTTSYFAIPVNETNAVVDGDDTVSLNNAGFTVAAQEDTIANAQGEFIQFTNHGISFVNGWGDSAANGTTLNPGPGTAGPGWKGPDPINQESKASE